MNRILAVARYQGIIDSKTVKTYVLLSIVVFTGIAYGYLLPKFASDYFFVYVKGPSAWMETISASFTTIATGLTAVLVGGMMTSDVLAEEFETGTISKLFSLPLHRMDIYLGKLLEKIILSAMFAIIFVSISIISAYELSGTQSYIVWVPAFILALVLLYVSFASLGFVLGTMVKRSSFVFGTSLGIWILSVIVYGVIMFNTGLSLGTYLVPYMNSSMIPGSLLNYALNPSGITHFTFNVAQNSKEFTTTNALFARSTILISFLETLLILLAGLFMFNGKQVRG
ncbi:MAG: ABC transporter permease [Cuniculiplasma sp.]